MKRIRVAILCLAAASCVHAKPFELLGNPTRTIPFAASNLQSTWVMRGTLRGHVDVHDNGLRVVAYADTIESVVSKADPSGGPDSIRVALASGDPDHRWRLEKTSNAVLLSTLSGRDSADLVIPDVRSADLTREWLVFEFRSRMISAKTYQRGIVTTYLHAPRTLLTM